MKFRELFKLGFFRFGVSVSCIFLTSFLLEAFHQTLNSTTVALAFLLIVLFSATFFGRNPALLSSFIAMLCFNYFFLPPVRTWTISEPQNLVAWGAFTLTAVIAGELSAYARRRAREAERLYEELQKAFAAASQAEAIKQSEKLKSALLDAVTHDLRTPLTSIKASVTMLIEENSADAIHKTLEREGRKELLEIINEESDRLNNFVESMVEVAKLEAGEFNFRKNEAKIEGILENTLYRAEILLVNHQVKLNIDNSLSKIYVDSKAISEALYNLLDNAVKYSPKDSKIKISAKKINDNLQISVEDEGTGIAESEREKVFQKFYRGDEKIKGFGMGLAIVRGIIEAHSGKIWVEQGKIGAKFVLELPIKIDE